MRPTGRAWTAGGTSEDDALAKLSSYVPRYAGVAERAGMADESASCVTAFEYVTIVDGALFSARS